MTDRELMQQALYALEQSRVFVTTREKIKHPEGTEWYDERIEALRARLAQPEQEPVAWMHPERNTYTRAPAMSITPKEDWIPLYTAPPQREWQGLTDEEIKDCFEMSMFGTCRAIEAKLKAKNA